MAPACAESTFVAVAAPDEAAELVSSLLLPQPASTPQPASAASAAPSLSVGERIPLLPGLDAEVTRRIQDRDQPHDAAVALDPAPRKGGERHALARDRVDLAAD